MPKLKSAPDFFEFPEETKAESELNHDILRNEIPRFLDANTFINYAESCKFLFFSLYPHYSALLAERDALLDAGARRDHEKAGKILLNYPDLLMREGRLADGFLDANNEKRVFKKITVIQYAGWALDMPMMYWLLIYWALSFAPKDTKEKMLQVFEAFAKEVEKQMAVIDPGSGRSHGLTYNLDFLKVKLNALLKFVPKNIKIVLAEHLLELEKTGTEYGSHYDCSTLTTPLKVFAENKADAHDWSFLYWSKEQCNAYWCKEVRDGQRQITQQVADEYCRNDGFFGVDPEFNYENLPRSDRFYDHASRSWREEVESGRFLGFAVIRGAYLACAILRDHVTFAKCIPRYDADTIDNLHAVRLREFYALIKQLNPTAELEAKKEQPFSCLVM